MENYQGAAKLAALDRHYHLALAYQLKALALATLEFGFDAEKHLQNQCTNVSKETAEKLSSSKRNCTESSDETTNRGVSSYHSNGDKIRSTNFAHNSNTVNEAKDRNSNPLIVNCKEQLKAYVTNVNSNCLPFQLLQVKNSFKNGSDDSETEITENVVSNSNSMNEITVGTEADINISSSSNSEYTAHYDDKDHDAANKMERGSSLSGTAVFEENIMNNETQSQVMSVPQNRSYKKEVVTETGGRRESESITKDENRNQKNFKLDLLYNTETETNQVLEGNKNKPNVQFSDDICVQLNEDLKPQSELPMIQSIADKMKPEFDIEEELKLKDSNQETVFVVKPTDHLSNKTQVFPIEEEVETSSSVSTPESLTSRNVHDSEMHAFAVQGGTEQMSEGHHLRSPDSSASPLVSEERGPSSPESFLPQVHEQSSHNASVNLSPINENRDFQKQVAVSFDTVNEKDFKQQKENPNKCETELISDLTSPLNNDINSTGDSESNSVVQQENVLEESDMNSRFLNDVEGHQRNSDAVTPVVEGNMSVVKQKEDVKNEDRKVKNESDNISHEFQNRVYCDQNNASECKSFATSDTLNETVSKRYSFNKECTSSDPNKILSDSDVCSKVVESDCNKFQHVVDVTLKSPSCKDSDVLQASDSVVEENLTAYGEKSCINLSTGLESLSFSGTISNVKMPNITEIVREPPVRALERSAGDHEGSSKPSCSDGVGLENYENELKVSSADRDFLVTEAVLESEVSVKSEKVVGAKVCDNTPPENIKSAHTDLISQSEASETEPSKIMYGNSTQQVNTGNTDESKPTKQLTPTTACMDLVGQAAAVVEYYVSVMEEDSHTMMSRLLQQVCLVYASC